MNEGAPYIPTEGTHERNRDDELTLNKRAEKIASWLKKLRRIEQGIETERDENLRQFKTSLRFIGFTLGSQAVAQNDDEE